MTFQITGTISDDIQGNFGVTYQGIDCETGKNVAIKVIKIKEDRINRLYPEAQQRAEKEGELLKQIQHENVVKFVSQCNVNDIDFQEKFQDKNYTSDTKCLITEWVDGVSLSDLIYKIPDEHCLEFIVRVILQIGKAIAYCHEIGIYHRDIYPKNIIVHSSLDNVSNPSETIIDVELSDNTGLYKKINVSNPLATIIDFGLGKKIYNVFDCDEDALTLDGINTISEPTLFSIFFRAPELIIDKNGKKSPQRKQFDNKPSSYGSADLFSLSMTLLWFLSQNGITGSLKESLARFNGIEFHRTKTKIERLEVIYKILEQRKELSKWDKLDALITGTLVDASFIERKPNTVKEWLKRLIDIFPEYENDEFAQDLGKGVTITMKRLPDQKTYISSEPITQEQWLAMMLDLPKFSIANANNKASLKGVSFKNVCNFIEKLQVFSKKKYRIANKSEIVEFHSVGSIENDTYLWHLENNKTFCCFWHSKRGEKVLENLPITANFSTCGIHPISFFVALDNI